MNYFLTKRVLDKYDYLIDGYEIYLPTNYIVKLLTSKFYYKMEFETCLLIVEMFLLSRAMVYNPEEEHNRRISMEMIADMICEELEDIGSIWLDALYNNLTNLPQTLLEIDNYINLYLNSLMGESETHYYDFHGYVMQGGDLQAVIKVYNI
jgi:hypothetical protein